MPGMDFCNHTPHSGKWFSGVFTSWRQSEAIEMRSVLFSPCSCYPAFKWLVSVCVCVGGGGGGGGG